MKLVPGLVEIFHFLLLERDPLDLFFRAKLVLGLQAGTQVSHLGLDKAALVARGNMDQLHNAVEVILMQYDHPHPQLGCRYEHVSGPPE